MLGAEEIDGLLLVVGLDESVGAVLEEAVKKNVSKENEDERA